MSKTDGSDTVTMEFTYNHAGLRTKKVKKVNSVAKETTEYILNGKNVVELIHTDNTTGTTPTVNKLHFYYDAQGRVALVDFNGTLYSYVHNLQGDIIGILGNGGNLVVEYKYDTWGKPIKTIGILTNTLGQFNPFRYREYIWDNETMKCYIASRYYDPSLCRFEQCDSKCTQKGSNINLGDHTLFIYCCNNPVIYYDPSGEECDDCTEGSVYRYFLYSVDFDILWDLKSWLNTTYELEFEYDPFGKMMENLSQWVLGLNPVYDLYDLEEAFFSSYREGEALSAFLTSWEIGNQTTASEGIVSEYEIACYYSDNGAEIGIRGRKSDNTSFRISTWTVSNKFLGVMINWLSDNACEVDQGYAKYGVSLRDFLENRS